MKKVLIIGAIALVVLGCVLVAGCTSTTTTTSEDFVIGTWTDGTSTYVITNDFKGVYTNGDKQSNFTWKKTTDGKYELINEEGVKVIVTLDKTKGTLTNPDGAAVLTKVLNGTSTTMGTSILEQWL